MDRLFLGGNSLFRSGLQACGKRVEEGRKFWRMVFVFSIPRDASLEGLFLFFEKVALGGGLSEGFEKNLLAAIRLQGSGAQVSGTCVSHMSELINGTGNEKELKEKIIYLFNPRFKEKELIRKNSLVRFSVQGYCRELQ